MNLLLYMCTSTIHCSCATPAERPRNAKGAYCSTVVLYTANRRHFGCLYLSTGGLVCGRECQSSLVPDPHRKSFQDESVHLKEKRRRTASENKKHTQTHNKGTSDALDMGSSNQGHRHHPETLPPMEARHQSTQRDTPRACADRVWCSMPTAPDSLKNGKNRYRYY